MVFLFAVIWPKYAVIRAAYASQVMALPPLAPLSEGFFLYCKQTQEINRFVLPLHALSRSLPPLKSGYQTACDTDISPWFDMNHKKRPMVPFHTAEIQAPLRNKVLL
jgi:hypothetical protein